MNLSHKTYLFYVSLALWSMIALPVFTEAAFKRPLLAEYTWLDTFLGCDLYRYSHNGKYRSYADCHDHPMSTPFFRTSAAPSLARY